jgi:hypothetical protein
MTAVACRVALGYGQRRHGVTAVARRRRYGTDEDGGSAAVAQDCGGGGEITVRVRSG